jgi:pyridoxine 4-dehydrogenase
MKAALANGANFWNGGEMYGDSNNNSLHLLNRYFKKNPQDASKVILSIKSSPRLPETRTPSGIEASIQRSVDDCIQVLDGTKSIDIFQFARVDHSIPIETTMSALSKCVKEGKIGGIGLSEVQADTIQRAHKVHPLAAVEVELSLWSRDIFKNGVAGTCAELGIPIIAYSPLGHGFLAGQFREPEDIPRGDMRRGLARFQPGAFEVNMRLLTEVKALADEKGCSPAQLAISWVKSFSERCGYPAILPIPGATTAQRVEENCKTIILTAEDMERIRSVLDGLEIVGGRYWW